MSGLKIKRSWSRIRHSLKTKIFLILAGVAMGASLIIGGVICFQYLKYIESDYKNALKQAALLGERLIPELSNPDYLKRAGASRSVNYWRIVGKLDAIQDIFECKYIYLLIKDGEAFSYLISSDFTANNPEGFYQEYFLNHYTISLPELLAAYNTGTPQITKTPYKDGWGTFVSLFYPIVKDNHTVAILGLDYEISYIKRQREQALNPIFMVFFLAALLLPLSLALSRSITDPIEKLAARARQLGAGDVDTPVEIRGNDEIAELGEAFNKMLFDIKGNISNIKRITAEKERIGTELNVAAKIQASMLPSIFPPFPNRKEFDIYAQMRPAKEVGGDFYDFFLIDENRLAVVIADVSGKGVPAALFMVIAKTLIKDHAQMGKPLDEVFYTVNNQLCENNESSMFVTAFMAVMDTDTGRLSYVNAGHNPPVIRQGGKGFAWLSVKPGIVLAAMKDRRFTVMETVLAEEGVLFLYTDGVNEAMNTREEFFGNDRILEALNAGPSRDIHGYVDGMLREIKNFAGGAEQADDITMLILQRKK